MATGDEKFRCSVSAEVNRLINKASNNRDIGKNTAVRYLVDLALAQKEHPVTVSGNGPVSDCSLQADKGFFATTLEYRNFHDLPRQKSSFLKDAITRGASIYKPEGDAGAEDKKSK